MMAAVTERVTIAFADGVADVRLNRADKMNALDQAMLDGIAAAGAELRAMHGLRAVVLSGEGKAFCAGLDIASFAASLTSGGLDITTRTHGRSNLFQHVAMLWRELPVPVIAAVHGVCFGGGLQIALGADIRVAAPETRFAVMEMKWGLVPDMGGFVLTRGLVRPDRLRELTYTARQVDAAEALDLGLVTHIAEDPYGFAMALAQEIAGRNPDAIRHAKALFDVMEDQDAAAILLAESVAQADIMARPNQKEAVMAGLAKRPPTFTD